MLVHNSDLFLCTWLHFSIALNCCCSNSVYYIKIKRARGALENKREPSIKMWKNVACTNVDYLLLWQWVWILQAAGLLIFLNKAIFHTDLWMKIRTIETVLWIVLVSASTTLCNYRATLFAKHLTKQLQVKKYM